MTDSSNITSTAKFDVISFAKNILREVDKIRASQPQFDDVTNTNYNQPAESRLNAFFRLIGLPMFVTLKSKNDNADSFGLSGDIHLTPGYGRGFSTKLSNYDIEDSSGMEMLSKRESLLLGEEGEIGSERKNAAMTLAITYPLDLEANIPDGESMEPKMIVTADGDREAFKRLTPLICCYIKGGITPISNELARPFLPDIKQQMPDEETVLPKPFIESVIRTRLISMGNASAIQKNNEDEFFSSIETMVGGPEEFDKAFEKNEELFQKTGLLERYVINKLMASLEQLAAKWVSLKRQRDSLRNKVSFKVSVETTSGKSSPLAKNVSVTADSIQAENSSYGQNIKKMRADEAREMVILSLLSTDDINTNDINSKIKNTKNVSSTALITPFITLVSGDLDQIKKNITNYNNEIKVLAKKVEDLRLELEMMTGEFTGLSVPDVVIVITALYLLKKDDLVALLDKETIENMKKDKVLEAFVANKTFDTAAAEQAVGNLKDIVVDLYAALNKTIELRENKDQRSRKIPNKKRK